MTLFEALDRLGEEMDALRAEWDKAMEQAPIKKELRERLERINWGEWVKSA